jgi:hypothetical protein
MKVPKDLRKIAAEHKKNGWLIEPAGSGHTKWSCPEGHVVTTTSSSPSNGHAVAQKTASILKRHECVQVAA